MLETLAAGRPLESLGPNDIRRFVATLHSKGQSPRSLARILSSWRGFFDWLVRAARGAREPLRGCARAESAARAAAHVLSPDDAVRLVSVEDPGPWGRARPRALRARVLVGLARLRAHRARPRSPRLQHRRSASHSARARRRASCPWATHALVAIAQVDRDALARSRKSTGMRSSWASRDAACCRARCSGASSDGPRSPASPWMPTRTCCATRSPRTCCNPRATCAPCRRCWATRASRPPRSTRTSTSSISPRSTTRRIRAPGGRDEEELRPVAASAITPVTVLTGFLGSGKTTLLNAPRRRSAFLRHGDHRERAGRSLDRPRAGPRVERGDRDARRRMHLLPRRGRPRAHAARAATTCAS